MNGIGELKEALAYYEAMRDTCRAESGALPKGTLSCMNINGTKYYYKRVNGKKYYIGRYNEEVRRLMSRYFFEQMALQLDQVINKYRTASNGAAEFTPYQLVEEFGEAYSDIPDECFCKLGLQPPLHGNSEQSKLDYHSDGLKQKAATGVFMRSKSEIIIADIYTARGLKYLYEEPLHLKNGETLYPDFTLVSKDGTHRVYHEHCGMMSDLEYRKRFFSKLDKYLKNGLIPFRDVIFTFDEPDGGIDVAQINRIISYVFT